MGKQTFVLKNLESMTEEELLAAQLSMSRVLECGVGGKPQLITVLRRALKKVGEFVDIPEPKYALMFKAEAKRLNVEVAEFDTKAKADSAGIESAGASQEFFSLLDREDDMDPAMFEREYKRLSKTAPNDFCHTGGYFYVKEK